MTITSMLLRFSAASLLLRLSTEGLLWYPSYGALFVNAFQCIRGWASVPDTIHTIDNSAGQSQTCEIVRRMTITLMLLRFSAASSHVWIRATQFSDHCRYKLQL